MDKAIVDRLCQPINLIESWENLCDAYETLRFVDQLDDATRLDEFQYIVRELNRTMGTIRNALVSCDDLEDAMQWLIDHRDPKGNVKIESRKHVAYQAFRSRWFANAISSVAWLLENEED